MLRRSFSATGLCILVCILGACDSTAVDEPRPNEPITDGDAPAASPSPDPPVPTARPIEPSRSAPLRDPPTAGPSTTGVSLVAVGDSLTYGQGSTQPGGSTSYPAVLGALLGVAAINRGVPGSTSKDLPDVDYLLSPGKQNRLVVMIGTNDIHTGTHANAMEAYDRLSSYVTARKASGWLVTVNTPPVWLAASRGSDPVAMEYEALIRTSFSHVADVAASPLIGRGNLMGPNRAYYGDEIGHLNDAGYKLLAQIVKGSMPPTGSPPTITPEMGVKRDSSLTGWLRDWDQLNVLPGETERPVKWLNMAEDRVFDGDFDAYGLEPPIRIADAINGKPVMRFNGPGKGFYNPSDRLSSHFVTANELVISVVMKVEQIVGSSSLPYDNDGVFSDSGTRLGLSVKRPNVVTAFTYDGAAWTRRDSTLPLNTPVVVSMRLFGGKLGLRVNTTGSWTETPAGNIDKLTNVLRIGTDSTNAKTFVGQIADVVIRKSYSAATMAADDAYFRARYAVP